MQLFGLVNTLLAVDRTTAKYDLDIRRYEVVPLSPASGLIEWVPAWSASRKKSYICTTHLT